MFFLFEALASTGFIGFSLPDFLFLSLEKEPVRYKISCVGFFRVIFEVLPDKIQLYFPLLLYFCFKGFV